jgi:hypothetical protein
MWTTIFVRYILRVMRTIPELIKALGGPRLTHDTVAQMFGLNSWTIWNWHKIGIPFDYWQAFIDGAAATPQELYEACAKVRKPIRPKPIDKENPHGNSRVGPKKGQRPQQGTQENQ